MFGLLLIPLLGFGGIAVDVGALYAEKAELQNGADAAALQVAIACATDEAAAACLSADPSAIAGANDSSDGVENIQSVAVDTGANEVTVTTNTEDLGVRHPLASMIPGIGDSTVVTAAGAAEWGQPISGSTLALAIGYCEFADHPPQEGVASPAKSLVEYNTGTRRHVPGCLPEPASLPQTDGPGHDRAGGGQPLRVLRAAGHRRRRRAGRPARHDPGAGS
jgi:hypothetical protein